MSRRNIVAAALAVLLLLTVVSIPSTQAAIPSSSYTYIIEGEEAPIGIDPLVLKTGLLIPQALLGQLGVRVQDLGDGTFSVTRGDVSLKLKVGSKAASQAGENLFLASAPVKVMGQLYIPDDAVSALGIRTTNESSVLYVDVWPAPRTLAVSADTYESAKQAATQERVVNPVKDSPLRVEVVRLNIDIVGSSSWAVDTVVRGRTQELMSNGTLIQVTIKNGSDRVLTSPAASYYLVDNLGTQYKMSESIAMKGDLFADLAPGAVASGILVYPSTGKDATQLSLYLQTSVKLEIIGIWTW